MRAALAAVLDPEIRKPITELDMVDAVSVDAAAAPLVGIKLTIVGCPAADAIERDVRAATAAVPGVTAVDRRPLGDDAGRAPRAHREAAGGPPGARRSSSGPTR